MTKNIVKLAGVALCVLSSVSVQALDMLLTLPGVPTTTATKGSLVYDVSQCIITDQPSENFVGIFVGNCTGANRKWQSHYIPKHKDFAFAIRQPADNTLCVDVQNGDFSAGAHIIQYRCHPTYVNQLWVRSLVPGTSDVYLYKPLGHTDFCMTVKDTGEYAKRVTLELCSADNLSMQKIKASLIASRLQTTRR